MSSSRADPTWSGSCPAGLETGSAWLRREGGRAIGDDEPARVDGPGGCPFWAGPRFWRRSSRSVEVGRAGRQEQGPRSGLADGLAHAADPVAGRSSTTTIYPGRSPGARTCSALARNVEPFIGPSSGSAPAGPTAAGPACRPQSRRPRDSGGDRPDCPDPDPEVPRRLPGCKHRRSPQSPDSEGPRRGSPSFSPPGQSAGPVHHKGPPAQSSGRPWVHRRGSRTALTSSAGASPAPKRDGRGTPARRSRRRGRRERRCRPGAPGSPLRCVGVRPACSTGSGNGRSP